MADRGGPLIQPGDGRQTIADHVYATLRAEIIRLTIRPGDTLSEAEVAKRFGVSRQPVREAFIHLHDERFLLIRPQRPTIVKPISEAAVHNARFIREAIEVAVIAEAVAIWDQAAADRLSACIAEQERASEADDREAFHAADERFHQIIAAEAGYPFAWDTVNQHKAQMDRVRYLTLGYATQNTIAEHKAIAAALEARDQVEAVTAMRRHLNRIVDHMSDIRAAHADVFEGDAPDRAIGRSGAA